jgi:hypothetical protein
VNICHQAHFRVSWGLRVSCCSRKTKWVEKEDFQKRLIDRGWTVHIVWPLARYVGIFKKNSESFVLDVLHHSRLFSSAICLSGTLIEEAFVCPSLFLVLELTNNSNEICCTALTIQKEFFTTPFLIPTSECGFETGRTRGVTVTESRRPGVICTYSCRAPHLQDQYWGPDRRSYE